MSVKIQGCVCICDPLREKGPFDVNNNFEMHVEKVKNAVLLANLLFVTGESYGLSSTFSRWSGVDSPLLALAASLCSCGRCRGVYCVIEIPRAISRDNAHGRSRTFTRIVLERKGL